MATPGQSVFCVLEGMDGTGTTTIAAGLAAALRARDLRVRTTAEPSDGPFGRLLRRHISGEITLEAHAVALLFTADRREHLEQTIRPALARDEWVVCDRYLLSTLAYQGAEGVPREAVLAASAGFDAPDVTFFLDAPDDVRAARISSRERLDRYEDPAIAAGLRVSYLTAIALLRERGQRIVEVDATAEPRDIVTELCARLDAGR